MSKQDLRPKIKEAIIDTVRNCHFGIAGWIETHENYDPHYHQWIVDQIRENAPEK